MANSQEVEQDIEDVGLYTLTLVLRIQKGVPAELAMTTNLEDFGQWARVFDRLRLEWERGRIREEERSLAEEEAER